MRCRSDVLYEPQPVPPVRSPDLLWGEVNRANLFPLRACMCCRSKSGLHRPCFFALFTAISCTESPEWLRIYEESAGSCKIRGISVVSRLGLRAPRPVGDFRYVVSPDPVRVVPYVPQLSRFRGTSFENQLTAAAHLCNVGVELRPRVGVRSRGRLSPRFRR